VNVRAPFLLARACAPGMAERGWGRIVNIGSIWSVVSIAQRASYSTSKFGVDGMTAAMSAELAASGILVNTVSPGFVDTELTRRVLGEDGIAELTARVPIRRLAQPSEIAALVAWVAGPDNTYLTGQNVVIDGGFTRT
jgi:3-oxoacyl-[acyl-carrier protein] reductase